MLFRTNHHVIHIYCFANLNYDIFLRLYRNRIMLIGTCLIYKALLPRPHSPFSFSLHLFFFEQAQTACCPLQAANSSVQATLQLAPTGTLPPLATVKTAPTLITVRVHSRFLLIIKKKFFLGTNLMVFGNFAGHEVAWAPEPVEPPLSHFPLSVPHLHVCFLHLHFHGFKI